MFEGIDWKAARVAVLGLGRSNLALMRHLVSLGCRPVGRDKKDPDGLGDYYHEAKQLGAELILGPGYLDGLTEYDVIFITPGMRKDLPEIESARASGALIGCEMQLFFEKCPAPIAGVTGSSGKTTTTSLIGEMLRNAGFNVHVGGNIGTPLIDRVDSIEPSDRVVLELSSFQLELMHTSPSISVVTNVTPNHLDAHPSMEAYTDAKKRIYRFGTSSGSSGTAVFNRDNAVTERMAEEARRLGLTVLEFSVRSELSKGAYLKDGSLCYRIPDGEEVKVCKTSELKLLGSHNVENALAATAAAIAAGAGAESAARVLRTFQGVEHRLQLVGSIDGVQYYNDSIATTPARAKAGILSFHVPIVLIAGGYDKHLPFDELAEAVCGRVRVLVLVGATADKIERAVRDYCDNPGNMPVIVRAHDFESAVKSAAFHAEPGEVVLLSPACASYDMFSNFEERGRKFAEIVAQIASGRDAR